MKNTFVKLLLLAALVSCLFIFASCDKLGVSIDDAEEIFEDEDWNVNVSEPKKGPIKAQLSANNGETDPDDYASFTMIEYDDEDLAKMAYEAKKFEREQDLDELKAELKAAEFYFDQYTDMIENYSSSFEKSEIKAMEEYLEEYEDEIKELEKEIEEFDDDYKFGRDGAIYWYGSIEGYELLTGK